MALAQGNSVCNETDAMRVCRLTLWGAELLFVLAVTTIGLLIHLDLNEDRGFPAGRAPWHSSAGATHCDGRGHAMVQLTGMEV